MTASKISVCIGKNGTVEFTTTVGAERHSTELSPPDAQRLAGDLLGNAEAILAGLRPTVGDDVGVEAIPVKSWLALLHATAGPRLALKLRSGLELSFQLTPELAISIGEALIKIGRGEPESHQGTRSVH